MTEAGAPLAVVDIQQQVSSSEKTKPVEYPHSREQVLKALTTGTSFAEKKLAAIPEDKRTPEQQHLLQTITETKAKTVDQGKGSFDTTFGDIFEDQKEYTQQEGFPTENLLLLIRDELRNGNLSGDEKRDLFKAGVILLESSKGYYDADNPLNIGRDNIAQRLARIRQEANFISKDARATGDPKGDWYLATQTMNQRTELIIPPPNTTIARVDRAGNIAVDSPQALAIQRASNLQTIAEMPLTTSSLSQTRQTYEDITPPAGLPAPDATAGALPPGNTRPVDLPPVPPPSGGPLELAPITPGGPLSLRDIADNPARNIAPIAGGGTVDGNPPGQGGPLAIPDGNRPQPPDVLRPTTTDNTIADASPRGGPLAIREPGGPLAIPNPDQPPAPPPTPGEDEPETETPPPPDPAPQDDEDETRPQPAPIPRPTSLNEVTREFAIINRTVDIRKRAAELAELAVRAEQTRGSAWNPLNWGRKVGMRVMEQYYRQVYTERAVAEMQKNANAYMSFTDLAKNAAGNANARRAEEQASGLAKAEQVKSGVALAGEDVREAQGALKAALMSDIIRPIVEGRITTPQQVQDTLKTFIAAHQNDADVKALFGNDATQYGRLAEYFASDLLETGELVKQDIAAHKYALDQLDQVVKIKLANTQWAAQTEVNFNWVDKLIAKGQSSKWGWVANPAFVGAAASLVTFGGMRTFGAAAKTANTWAPGIGLALGAAFAGLRRNMDLKRDMASHQAEMAYGATLPDSSQVNAVVRGINHLMHEGATKREALQKYAYETATVDEILNGTQRTDKKGNKYDRPSLGGDARGMKDLLAADLSQANNQESLLRRMAEIQARLDFSTNNKVDLLTYESREQVEQGRMELVKAIVEGRLALRRAGVADAQITAEEQRLKSQWEQRFTLDKAQQDRAFLMYRLRSSAKAAAIGGITGYAGGLVSQEALAVTGRIFDVSANAPGIGGLFGRGTTRLESHVNAVASFLGQPDVFADRSNTGFLGVDLNDAFAHPKDYGLGGNRWLAVHPDVIDGGRAMTIVTKDAAGNVISTEPTPPMWIQGGHDGNPATVIINGTPDNLPPALKSVLGVKEHHLTSTHNMHDYIENTAKVGPANAADEVLGEQKFKGNTIVNTHDIVQSKIHGVGDPNKTYDQWAIDANRIDPATGKVEVGKMSLTGPNGMQLNGFLRSDGTFDADLKHYGNVDLANNPAEMAKTLQSLRQDAWGVVQDAKTPSLYHLTPPVATEYVMEVSEAPIIVTPFAPRFPLEPLTAAEGRERKKGEDEVQETYYMKRIGPEERREFEQRKSPRLKENPEAQLDPKQEAEWYLSQQSPEYRTELEQLNNAIGEPMSEDCEAVVCIAAASHQEGDNIYNTLMQYTDQRDENNNPLSPSKFEVVLFLNRPEFVKDNTGHLIPSVPDKTAAEVDRFKQQHPNIKVRVINKVFQGERPKMGVISKYPADIALLRSLQRQNKSDVALIMNDADMDMSSNRYVSSIVNQFKKDPQIDGLLGKIEWNPESYIKYPGFHIANRFYQYIEAQQRHASGPARNVGSSGANFSLRASMYAAVGGYMTSSDLAQDVQLGNMIKVDRGTNKIGDNAKALGYSGGAWVMTSPRRGTDAYEKGIPVVKQWNNWSQNQGNVRRNWKARPTAAEDVDSLDIDHIQMDINAAIDTYTGNPRSPMARRALNMLGLYSTEDYQQNIDELQTKGLTLTSPEMQQRLAFFGLNPGDYHLDQNRIIIDKGGNYHIGKVSVEDDQGKTTQVDGVIITDITKLQEDLKKYRDEERNKQLEARNNAATPGQATRTTPPPISIAQRRAQRNRPAANIPTRRAA